MNDLKIDIENAKKMINGKSSLKNEEYNNMFEQIYSFTNENLIKIFNNFNVLNKECLTVLGSSDQTFDLFLRGAKSIDAFDINPFTKYFFNLKKAALLSNISLEEYLSFFQLNRYVKDERRFIDLDIEYVLDKIMNNLDNENLEFWEYLYDDIIDIKNFKKNPLFIFDKRDTYQLKRNILYLNTQDRFNKLKEKASIININFYNVDMKNLKYVLTKNYDFMYFSNIIEYSKYMFTNNKNDYFKKYIEMCLELLKSLNSNCEAMIGLFFGTDFWNDYKSFLQLYNKILLKKDLGEFKRLEIDSKNYGISDNCFVYKKR